MEVLTTEDVVILVEYREVGGNGGASLELFLRVPARVSSKLLYVWRVDCFRINPHHHMFGPRGGERVQSLKPLNASGARQWCSEQLQDLPALLKRLGHKRRRTRVRNLESRDAHRIDGMLRKAAKTD